MADLGLGLLVDSSPATSLSDRQLAYLYTVPAVSLADKFAAWVVTSDSLLSQANNPFNYTEYSDGIAVSLVKISPIELIAPAPDTQLAGVFAATLYSAPDIVTADRLRCLVYVSDSSLDGQLFVSPVRYLQYSLGNCPPSQPSTPQVTVYYLCGFDVAAGRYVYWQSAGAPDFAPVVTKPPLVGALFGAFVVGAVGQ